ncbi:MAG: hypothetical protein EOR04_18010 [Mesorhizobium sp.]|uniref:hypothetical protein n=1 Tax=Mesorhizobium sp. TaxID=1871066 RepID=UPI000FE8CBD0|nr:hypothetical protein [Mesorhizobium sp.]RWP40712.1 MAG: hypothetical protein EOR04_18010 [Mesorhizobium sp.]
MPVRTAQSVAKALLICLLALAVLGFRSPVPDFAVSDSAVAAAHDHHGHSHEDGDEPTASGQDHDRFHVGDHSPRLRSCTG